MIDQKAATLFDTDMHIHRISCDRNVRHAAEQEFLSSKPSAICSFSLLELKGNYIQDLILLRNKTGASDDFESMASRIMNSGGRRCMLMLSQLIRIIGKDVLPVYDWDKTQNILLTHIDAQIAISWNEFKGSVDEVVDLFNCTRAKEEPSLLKNSWKASIPRCNINNCQCTINSNIISRLPLLKQYLTFYEGLESSSKTNELDTIADIISKTVYANKFPWTEGACRKVGDLLIALHAIDFKEFLSSNYKEHSQLSKALNYEFRKFDVASIRLK